MTEEKRLESELRTLSDTDPLTELFNRRFLDKTLDEELTRAREYGLDLSILMFDVDHFKPFNDNHGHDQGDRVLQSVAETIRFSIRTVDIPCRYGGEEFLVILPNTPVTMAAMVAERIRSAIENLLVDGLQVTITIGVANYPDLDAIEPTDMVEAADKALYVGKDNGRNQVVIAGDPPVPVVAETGEPS